MPQIIYPTGHYVYAYMRRNAPTPYYIGQGTRRRAWNKHVRVPVPKDLHRIVIVEQNLTLVGACAIERRLIAWYGRKDLGTGILLNRTDGGQHATNLSPAARARLSQAGTGRNNKLGGTSYWNDGHTEIRSKKSPGPNWVPGRVDPAWNKGQKLGYHWVKGTDRCVALECPGEGWTKEGHTKGQIRPRSDDSNSNHKGTLWWTRGKERRRSAESPGPEWVRGSGVRTLGSTGLRWWNDGEKSVQSKESPGPNWHQGRLQDNVSFDRLYNCPTCGKIGKGPGMKNHFRACARVHTTASA